MPGSADVHRLLGLNYYALEQYRLFQLQMRKAKELRPDDGEFDYWLGRYYQVISEDCAKAIPLFTRAISLDLENHRALYNRGDCYERSSEVAAAEKDYAAASKLIHRSGARDSWPFQALANLFLRINRSTEALALAREAISLEPDASANHLILGKIWAQMKTCHTQSRSSRQRCDSDRQALPPATNSIAYMSRLVTGWQRKENGPLIRRLSRLT